MDRDGFLLHGEAFPNPLPLRRFSPMPAQALVSLTLYGLVAAGMAWLMAETPRPVAQPLMAKERRV